MIQGEGERREGSLPFLHPSLFSLPSFSPSLPFLPPSLSPSLSFLPRFRREGREGDFRGREMSGGGREVREISGGRDGDFRREGKKEEKGGRKRREGRGRKGRIRERSIGYS